MKRERVIELEIKKRTLLIVRTNKQVLCIDGLCAWILSDCSAELCQSVLRIF